MRHTLRKYLSNRGSALFMVLSTMTALMISCMAMYFSVVSSRSTQYAIFNQQQSYQSAISISDTIIASWYQGGTGFEELYNKLVDPSFAVGQTLTANSNGFAAFDVNSTGKEDDDQVGAYTLEATRLPDQTMPDGTVLQWYDLIVTTSVNGVKEVYHNKFNVVPATIKKVAQEIQPGFGASGYAPNNVFFDGGDIRADVYCDNPETPVNAYGGKQMKLDGNLTSGGSFTVNSWLEITAQRQVYFAVRDTFTSYANQAITFYTPTGSSQTEKDKNKSYVMIGGDCKLYNNAKFQNANVYVLGDLYVKGNTFVDSANYFVNGDVILEGGYWHDLSHVYCNGVVDTSKNTGGGINAAVAGRWDTKAKGFETDGLMTKAEVVSRLEEKTASASYDLVTLPVDVSTLKEKTIEFRVDAANPVPTQVLKYSDAEKGCIIKDIVMVNNNNATQAYQNHLTLVIDTGDDPDNVYSISLQPTRDYIEAKPGDDTFCWFPRNKTNGTDKRNENGNVSFQVLVMGRGSVMIEVPEGVTYQDDDFLKVWHYGWFTLNGGEEFYYGDPAKKSDHDYRVAHTAYVRKGDSSTDADFFANFVHRACYSGCGCAYTEAKSTDECEECGAKKTDIVCDVHGTVKTYCKTCNPTYATTLAGEELCKDRVDRTKIDKFLNSHPEMKARMMGEDGKLIYPNVNIFLISCDENADIRLSSRSAYKAEGATDVFIQNSFFGYVYAPYLTYKAGPSNSGGGMVRTFGGFLVSDFIMDDSYSMISCFPDNAGILQGSGKLTGIANKSWKINLGAY